MRLSGRPRNKASVRAELLRLSSVFPGETLLIITGAIDVHRSPQGLASGLPPQTAS